MLLEGGHRRRASSSAATTISSTGVPLNGTGAPATAAAAKRHSLRLSETLKKGTTPGDIVRRDDDNTKEQPKQVSQETPPHPKEPVDVTMEDLTGAMSALRFVPPSIRFGHGKGRSGFSRK